MSPLGVFLVISKNRSGCGLHPVFVLRKLGHDEVLHAELVRRKRVLVRVGCGQLRVDRRAFHCAVARGGRHWPHIRFTPIHTRILHDLCLLHGVFLSQLLAHLLV